MLSRVSSLALLSFASSILAKTNLTGCTSSDVLVNGATSVLWYVPGSGEVCSTLDCGGGGAPPTSDVPGCPAYTGTASYTLGFDSTATLTPTGTVPTGSILTDSSIPSPASTLVPIASPTSSNGLTDTTTTLGVEASGSAAPSLVTSALVFDTSSASPPVTNLITVTSSPPASTTSNAAVEARSGRKRILAAVGAAAGLLML